MGASESKLSLGYTLKENLGENTFFSLFTATDKATDKNVSVFLGKPGILSDPGNFKLLQHAVQKLKTLRHPGIIKFVQAQVQPTELVIVTEPVVPLKSVLKGLHADDICLGIYGLLKTIDFLHSKGLCHNSLSIDSIYISENGKSWLLGGMEFVKAIDEIDEEFIQTLHSFLPESSHPPEDIDEDLAPEVIESRDFFALGQLLGEIISPFLTPLYIQTIQDNVSWKDLQSSLDIMCARNPDLRLSPRSVLGTTFFKDNVLIDIVETFKEIQGIQADIKRRLFSQFSTKIRCLAPTTVSRIVLPLVLKMEIFSEAGASLMFKDLFGVQYDKEMSGQTLKRSLTIIKEDSEAPLLPEAIYNEQILPFVKKALSLRQYDARLICLQLLDKYISELCAWDASCLPLVVDELLLGLEDVDVDIYIHSLKGLCSITPRCLDLKESRSDKKVDMKPVRDLRGSKARSSLSNLLQYASDAKILGEDIQKTRSEGGGDLISNVPSPVTLVENVLIPHVLKACMAEDIAPGMRWSLLNSVVELWKYLSITGAKTRSMEAIRLSRSLHKCFHVVMRLLDAEDKVEFFCHMLVGANVTDDPTSMTWIPKIMEIGLHFVKDDNRLVRTEIGQTLVTVVNLISAAMDRTPTVSRKREQDSFKSKLKTAYGGLKRTESHFPRTGPRTATVVGQGVSPGSHGPGVSSVSQNGHRGTVIDLQSMQLQHHTRTAATMSNASSFTFGKAPSIGGGGLSRPVAVESNWEQDWGSELEGGIQEDEFENEEFGGGRIPSLSRLTMSSEGPGIAPPPSAVAKPQGGSNYVTFSKELSSAGMSIDGLSRLPSALSSDKVLKSAPMKQAHKGVASTDMADLGLGSWDHDDLSLQDIELK